MKSNQAICSYATKNTWNNICIELKGVNLYC
uniref:Uncharacterized protein n=1 Tax=Anguilla anguilla TaxID=7936 RepID=A0A0E9V392_ANGAN